MYLTDPGAKIAHGGSPLLCSMRIAVAMSRMSTVNRFKDICMIEVERGYHMELCDNVYIYIYKRWRWSIANIYDLFWLV